MKKIISLKKARAKGLIRYFTGIPCKKGHIYERSVSGRSCLKCRHVKKRKFGGKFKKCTNCKKRLKKISKNFRYISKKRGVLNFRPICRPCERKLYSQFIKTPKGKKLKKKRDKRYKSSPKGRAADKRYYDKNQPKLMKISVAKRALQRKTIPHIKIRDNLALRMRLALKEQNLTKRNTTTELVGCSIKYLKQYLERKFKPGMTWRNQSRFGWHIDHIKPCSKFDLSDPIQQKICFNYKNLQPLWAEENIRKSNK